MTTPRKLDSGEIHLIQLIDKDKNESGWTLTSRPVLSLVRKLPQELVEVRERPHYSYVRLTPTGQQVFNAIAYFI
jgi:hypothetical protein